MAVGIEEAQGVGAIVSVPMGLAVGLELPHAATTVTKTASSSPRQSELPDPSHGRMVPTAASLHLRGRQVILTPVDGPPHGACAGEAGRENGGRCRRSPLVSTGPFGGWDQYGSLTGA
ncbi:MAG: hypothetical protein ABSA21_03140 [Candidatus Limnocylindrales bacterium]